MFEKFTYIKRTQIQPQIFTIEFKPSVFFLRTGEISFSCAKEAKSKLIPAALAVTIKVKESLPAKQADLLKKGDLTWQH